MFGTYVYERSFAQETEKILLLDDGGLCGRTDYPGAFRVHGFEVACYTDDLTFRLRYEQKLKTPGYRLAVLARSEQYIPYDLLCRLRRYAVTLENLFPRLHPEPLRNMDSAGLDLLCAAYRSNFDDLRQKRDTEQYLRAVVYGRDNVQAYLQTCRTALLAEAGRAASYRDWFSVAAQKAQLGVMAAKYDLALDVQEVNRRFQDFILSEFGKLSQCIDKSSPVLVSGAMEYMHERSERFVIVVMDGMSEFDWALLRASFEEIAYEKSAMLAMIPSTTAVSRQCLLSGKYPGQLMEPWKQSREKAEFVQCARALGFTERQIGYARGYDAQFSALVRCGAVIINDVDDLVHAQTQGSVGMYHDVAIMAGQKKLPALVRRLLAAGYDVYLTADHGNTACTGLGRLLGMGVEVETKSHRMLVLKDFADKQRLMESYGLIEYPKYYLPKEYDYLVCDAGDSFDAKGASVMTHGGITLDEVVVPFITIKAVENNG